MSDRKSILKKTAVNKPGTSWGDHTPVHDNSTLDQNENISADFHQIQQSLTDIWDSMVKKKNRCDDFGLRYIVRTDKWNFQWHKKAQKKVEISKLRVQ